MDGLSVTIGKVSLAICFRLPDPGAGYHDELKPPGCQQPEVITKDGGNN